MRRRSMLDSRAAGGIDSRAMNHGSLGVCSCGYIAIARCQGCGALLCETHATEIPQVPDGLSENAQIKFAGAVRLMGGDACVNCRAERGRRAISEAISAPRAPLPDPLAGPRDRAVDRPDAQRAGARFDGQLPVTLTASEVAAEFLRRMAARSRARASPSPRRRWLQQAGVRVGLEGRAVPPDRVHPPLAGRRQRALPAAADDLRRRRAARPGPRERRRRRARSGSSSTSPTSTSTASSPASPGC